MSERAVIGSGADLSATVSALNAARTAWRARREEAHDGDSFPSREAVARMVDTLAAALYPRRLGRFRGEAAGARTRSSRPS